MNTADWSCMLFPQVLCHQNKFRCDPFEWVYEGLDPLMLPAVVTKRKGIPLSLAVAAGAVARRLGMDVQLVCADDSQVPGTASGMVEFSPLHSYTPKASMHQYFWTLPPVLTQPTHCNRTLAACVLGTNNTQLNYGVSTCYCVECPHLAPAGPLLLQQMPPEIAARQAGRSLAGAPPPTIWLLQLIPDEGTQWQPGDSGRCDSRLACCYGYANMHAAVTY